MNLWEIIEKMIDFILCKLLRLKINETQWVALMQFVKFGIVGLSNTVISYVIYVVTLILFQKNNLIPSVDYLAAQVIAFILSVLWSFYWNNKFVFKKEEGEHRNIWAALFKTYVSYGFTGLILNNVLSVIWVSVLHVSKMIAPIINLIINIPINFFLNKIWAFGKK